MQHHHHPINYNKKQFHPITNFISTKHDTHNSCTILSKTRRSTLILHNNKKNTTYMSASSKSRSKFLLKKKNQVLTFFSNFYEWKMLYWIAPEFRQHCITYIIVEKTTFNVIINNKRCLGKSRIKKKFNDNENHVILYDDKKKYISKKI